MRIAQVAGFYGPTSGGLRTAVDAVGAGYVAAGIDRVVVVPGATDDDERSATGRRITIRSPRLPGGAGYRLLVDGGAVRRALLDAGADRLELSDRLHPRLARWARRVDIPTVLWAHERLDAILDVRVPRWVPLRRATDTWNELTAAGVERVVCSSRFAATEWRRIGAPVRIVPLGVDLDVFRPRWSATEADPADRVWRLVHVGRLSREKRPEVCIDAVRALVARGQRVTLTVVGTGPMAGALRDQAGGHPVRFTGHVADRTDVAAVLAASDVALAPCPVETFGLGIAEALACGVAVVAADGGAAPELVSPATGRVAPPTGAAIAAAVEHLLATPLGPRRRAARAWAERHGWATTVEGMLAAHGVPRRHRRTAEAGPPAPAQGNGAAGRARAAAGAPGT